MGSRLHHCLDCGHSVVLHNSCRNRHCPQCQADKQRKWVDDRLADTLPVSYFHVVFTLPGDLQPIALYNQKLIYSLLFKCASETLLYLAKDKKHLGASTGLIAVLHTWGQALSFHTHLHCIVPGGGISNDGLRFVHSSKKFFLPVKVVSKIFRGKFLEGLQHFYDQGTLLFPKSDTHYTIGANFKRLITKLYYTNWVVYCKKPFASPAHVIRYLGRYTHRVAISNNRIKAFSDGKVTFEWKDYKDTYRKKLMTLDASEFIRRFLTHVLPDGFFKIRHYGILGNRNKKLLLAKCRKLVGISSPMKVDKPPVRVVACRACGSICCSIMFLPRQHSPPLASKLNIGVPA